MAGSNVGLCDTYMLQRTAKIDTSKVGHLNRYLGFPVTKATWKGPTRSSPPAHSIKTSATGAKSVRTAKNGSGSRPGKKVKCDHGYQDISPSGAVQEAKGAPALKSEEIQSRI
jgi:hypothetical protein